VQLENLLRIADCIFANSLSVAARIAAFCGERGLSPPEVKVLQFGNTSLRRLHAPMRGAKPTPYALVVGSIDVRKNQRSLLPVWSRLIDELGAEKTPQLVLIGKQGVKANEFFSALRSSSKALKSKVTILSDVDDRQLAGYYAESLFTIFPSLAEGWGLPVVESLALGKVCIASNGGSIREAGGSLACYFDSADSEELFRLVKMFIGDANERVIWENRIKLNFEERNWQDTADALLAHLKSAGGR
jgi:glycosyltransferase involved in cell wall biosynthesis